MIGDADGIGSRRDAQLGHLLRQIIRGLAADQDADGVGQLRPRPQPAEDGHEVFRAQLDLQLIDLDAGPLQVRAFGRGRRMPVVGVFEDEHDIFDALLDQPVGDDLAHDGAGRGGAEDVVDALAAARRLAFDIRCSRWR